MDPDLGYLMKVVEEYKYRLTDGEYLEILDINKNPIAKIAIEDINNGNTAKIHKI